eukprot:CAMPEP_0114313860 /NCGR_PEP_ID=MMETSP0059-20121206/21404_1 /TAXON_ID=36894 /ORGANISM="Pyramimonas parkeae, Strain CCMP726" /LENGTH=97 /DNA_ID=CAMNT_0001438771 /DNA_START=149 /DNA_END=439 /DNA_ORIENTATION=+
MCENAATDASPTLAIPSKDRVCSSDRLLISEISPSSVTFWRYDNVRLLSAVKAARAFTPSSNTCRADRWRCCNLVAPASALTPAFVISGIAERAKVR